MVKTYMRYYESESKMF